MSLYTIAVLCFSVLLKFTASYKIEGRVFLPGDNSIVDATIIINDGQYNAFMKADGSFVVHNVPSGTYVVEVILPRYMFEPTRVDISSKGNVRARKLNNLKPSAVTLQSYPLEMKPLALMKYFQVREKFSVLDMLKNPMVLMMVLPMVMLIILPKLMNASDPETRKEMENSMNMFNQNSSQMPDLAEMASNFFGGGPKKKAVKPSSSSSSGKSGKVQKRRKND